MTRKSKQPCRICLTPQCCVAQIRILNDDSSKLSGGDEYDDNFLKKIESTMLTQASILFLSLSCFKSLPCDSSV